MTERSSQALDHGPRHFRVGPSALHWDGEALTIDLDEITNPIPSRIRGQVTVRPKRIFDQSFCLDGTHHHWWPIAPDADIDVMLPKPGRAWSGHGYLDSNWGTRGLEADFARWDWSRAPLSDGAAILYNGTKMNGDPFSLSLKFGANGRIDAVDPPADQDLPTTFWRIKRQTRCDPGRQARVIKTLEDTPFYARSLLKSHLFGEEVDMMHESLDGHRFASPVVQMMLPFKMPRVRR